MLFGPSEKLALARCPRLLHRRPNSAARGSDLLIRFTSEAAFEIIETISGKDEMRMRIDKSRQHNSTFRIDDLRVARLLLDFIAGSDDVDLAVANKYSAVGNDRQLRHLDANARLLWTHQRDKLRSVKKSERFQFRGSGPLGGDWKQLFLQEQLDLTAQLGNIIRRNIP